MKEVIRMRNVKLTTDKKAPAHQRKRTEKLLEKSNQLSDLPTAPPKYLHSYARSMWTKVVPYLNSTKVVKTPDRALVEALCINYQILRESYNEINKSGVQAKIIKSLQNSSGEVIGKDFIGYKANPALKSIDSASVKINSLGSQLGLSPSARAQLTSLDIDEDDTNVADLLNGGDKDEF
ncbi:phage terminase small subunit P27 family [Lactobacillus sp. ESL0791]|uniref:phage terminase small subunit P27 family n=1 Tax=Lactobacillus sp. ESL0791 TaxID=2983234 RepID=UPI0023F8CB13|nr:phage terminase small subunit P27 family [Lactobacillus sp. ESL0791]MDF7639950.1 phage terminase small subunit P27 family [Lactobacillus sp. ESL0791]